MTDDQKIKMRHWYADSLLEVMAIQPERLFDKRPGHTEFFYREESKRREDLENYSASPAGGGD
jgi:hypothetical protein